MHKSTIFSLLALATLAAGPITFAQNEHKVADTPKVVEPAPHFYHVVFMVQELGADGKPTNSRSYSTTVLTAYDRMISIRANFRVPVATFSAKSSSGEETPTQFQFMDIGVNFDIREVREVGRDLTLGIRADISSIFPSSDPKIKQPVVRHDQWEAPVLIPIGKPTTIFSSDALDSRGSMQIVATATQL
jgi:hypothetical protein